MALIINDRVKETTTSTGTGTINLGGAQTGFQSFVSGIGNGNQTYYTINGGSEWEVGYGTVTDAATDTLSRTAVFSSSNSGSLVNFSAGTKDVFCTLPASQTLLKNTFPVTVVGTINKGDQVALLSDATVLAPAGTDYASLYGANLQTDANVSSADVNSNIATNSDGSLLLQIYATASGNDVSVVAGTVSAGVVTWGTPLVIAITLPSTTAVNVTFDPTSGNFVIYYFSTASTLAVRTISVSGTTCTANTAVTTSNIDDDIRVLPAYYDSTAGKHVVMVHPTATDYPSAIVVTVSTTTVSLAATVTIVSTASTSTFIWADCMYNSTLNKGIFLFHNASGAVSLALGTISAGVISFGSVLSTGLTITTGNQSMTVAVPFVSYDSDQSKVLMVYVSSNSGTIYSYTVSTTTLTASTTYSITSSSSTLFGIYYLSSKKVLILMGTGGTAETFYLNTTTATYYEDTNFTTNIGTVAPTPGQGSLVRFGSIIYLNSGQRFGFYQSTFQPAVACVQTPLFSSNLKIFDIPTTDAYYKGATGVLALQGISRSAFSNGNKVTLGQMMNGNYDNGTAAFTFNTNYYKTYSGSFTTSSTAAFGYAGISYSTTILYGGI